MVKISKYIEGVKEEIYIIIRDKHVEISNKKRNM
jgi:hypothetical protein